MWRAAARLFIRELRQLAPHLRRRADTQHGSGVAGVTDGPQLSGGVTGRRADGDLVSVSSDRPLQHRPDDATTVPHASATP